MDEIPRLAKEALVILFRRFPGDFVLIGGGALHWIFNSPRLSVDIDLKPLHPKKRRLIEQIATALSDELPAVLSPLGKAVTCSALPDEEAVQVRLDGRPALRIELVSLAPVTGKEKHLLQSDSLQSEIIVTPDIHQLLFAKAAALLQRSHVKGRDVFDIWFLQSRGAVLDEEAFSTWLRGEEKDAQTLQEKLKTITPSRLKSDLGRFLPEAIRSTLEAENYRTLIEAAKRLLQPFL